ncbi:fructose PTS transporter subunit IIA [Glycomyces luteolus]|uniref:Fructose PTS transporter subunit IIA n=1 Tax=Glycomyces luteolus TaxID=2670330 RepID=A0A9X3P8I2_9ACTN|nr:fructose PTS transporter subunit IIA [Glycomyces luteolus]MDA1360069.1 fructose PTS transporter subunit IIA [Glycomyces luteolus]
MSDLITADLIDLDLHGADRHEATARLAGLLAAAGRVTDADGFLADVRAREEQMPTGIEGGIGIPHARSAHVTAPSLAFGRAPEGIDFGSEDGPADLVFLIAAPEGGGSEHMTILAKLARKLIHQDFKTALREAPEAEAAAALIQQSLT